MNKTKKYKDAIVFKVSAEEKDKFKNVCSKKSINTSELLRSYVKACNEANTPLFIL